MNPLQRKLQWLRVSQLRRLLQIISSNGCPSHSLHVKVMDCRTLKNNLRIPWLVLNSLISFQTILFFSKLSLGIVCWVLHSFSAEENIGLLDRNYSKQRAPYKPEVERVSDQQRRNSWCWASLARLLLHLLIVSEREIHFQVLLIFLTAFIVQLCYCML